MSTIIRNTIITIYFNSGLRTSYEKVLIKLCLEL